MTIPLTFRYEAIDAHGRSLSGTIDAVSADAGREMLQALSLSVRRFEAVSPTRVSPLGRDDLATFNEQLAQLSRAGLPVEHGLKLLASDMSSGKLKRAVDAVNADLAAGNSLAQAIARQRSAFPPLYANLVDAGVRCNDLPGVLFGLNRHLDITQQIRSALSRATAYPTVILIAILSISALLSAYVLPQLANMFDQTQSMNWNWSRRGQPSPGMPAVTLIALEFGRIAPFLAGAAIAAALFAVVVWPWIRSSSLGLWISDSILTRLPLVGRPLRYSLVGRWCDVASIGVAAGLDLPAALSTASDAIGSTRLHIDTKKLIEAHNAGRSLDVTEPLDLLPSTVPGAMQLSMANQQLAPTLATLRDMYLRQAHTRARMIPLTLLPLLILLMAFMIGGILMALFTPMIRLLNNMM